MKPFVSAPEDWTGVKHPDSAQMGTLKPKEVGTRPGKRSHGQTSCPPHLWSARRSQGSGVHWAVFSFSSCPVYFRELSSTYISAPTLYLHSRGMVSTLSFSTNYTHKVQGKNLSDSTHRPLNAGPQDIAPGKGYRLPEGKCRAHRGSQAGMGTGEGRPGLPNLLDGSARNGERQLGTWGLVLGGKLGPDSSRVTSLRP